MFKLNEYIYNEKHIYKGGRDLDKKMVVIESTN
jgi:hypothetical protein